MSLSRVLARALSVTGALALLWPAAAHAQAASALGGWNLAEQRAVVADGLLGNAPDGHFEGQLALSSADMQAVLAALARRSSTAHVSGWNDRSVAGFDAAMVDVLGLGSVASHVQRVASSAGLRPPHYFGTEVIARQLGLRFNHPAGQDALELYPSDPITRAEAAHSLARIAAQGAWAVPTTRALYSAFALPAYSAAALLPLTVAVSRIGMPYVWGGVSDTATAIQAHGGYDCSGLIWRAFRLSGSPAGSRIGGRTAAQMAGEISRSARLALNALAPGDLLFFGDAGFRGSATEASITHSAIALSAQWAIESSDQGVNVAPLTSGWLNTSFAWARRVLSGVPAQATPTVAAVSHRPSPAHSHPVRSPVRPRRHSSPPAPMGETGGLAATPGSAPPPATVGHTGGAGFPG